MIRATSVSTIPFFLRFFGLPCLLPLVLFGCSLEQFEKPRKFSAVPKARVNSYLQIPTKVWEDIEKTYDLIELPGKEPLTDMKITFVPMAVRLLEKNKGALGGENFEIEIPEGGGIVDFAQFVEKGRRTFYLEMRLEESLPEVSKVYFVPHYRPQQIDGKSLGLKCSQAVDITSYFKEKMSWARLALNTSDWRYLNLVGGVFIVFYFNAGDLFLTQVTFHDSRRKELRCNHVESAVQ